jgi:DNA-3-methyladenine glycosylase
VGEVARALLGARLVSTIGGTRTSGVIVETEAYGGEDDAASHAATVRGPTERNRAMYGPSGRAYVYRIYGMHWCVNVVTGREGEAQAVLIRGLEPLDGVEVMARRRSNRQPLTAGPGRLCEALGISGDLYGHDLRAPPLELKPGWSVPDPFVGVSGRIGVSAAADEPFRFYVLGSFGVSRGS